VTKRNQQGTKLHLNVKEQQRLATPLAAGFFAIEHRKRRR
jgi:hypothetical protein